MKILSVNYVLCFGRVKIHKRCLYLSVFSTDINGKIIFNCLVLYRPFLLVSKLYQLVSKFHNFLTCSETEARCIFEGFLYCHLWKVQFELLQYFFEHFFIWSVNCSNQFFSPFWLVSKLDKLNLWFQRCPEA